MREIEFFAIGHITNDLEPVPHLGGGVSYSAVAAHRFGLRTHIITEAPPNHPYLDDLTDLGIAVHRLPAAEPRLESNITSFQNFYDEKGHRRQIVSNRQDDINLKDLPNFPEVPKNSVLFVAPVIAEVDPELFPEFIKQGRLVVTPQGYFRVAGPDGTVKRAPWGNVDALSKAELVIFSDEDLTFDGQMDQIYFKHVRDLCSLIVLTQGTEGLTVFKRGEEPIQINAFKLEEHETRSPTGAGDSCAAAFTWYYLINRHNLKEAGVFAALYPALKIMGIGGQERGVQTLPTLEQVKKFIESNQERFKNFLKSNGLNKLSLD